MKIENLDRATKLAAEIKELKKYMEEVDQRGELFRIYDSHGNWIYSVDVSHGVAPVHFAFTLTMQFRANLVDVMKGTLNQMMNELEQL